MTTINSITQASYDTMFGRDRGWHGDIDGDPFKALLDAEAAQPDTLAADDDEIDTVDEADDEDHVASEEKARDSDNDASSTDTGAAGAQQPNLLAQQPLFGLMIVKSKGTRLAALAALSNDNGPAAKGGQHGTTQNPLAGTIRTATSVAALTRGANGESADTDTPITVKQAGQGATLNAQAGEGATLDADVTQQRIPVTSRPQAAVGATGDGTETVLAKRNAASDAAQDVFAKGQSAIERLAARKADQRAGIDTSAAANGSGNGKPSTFAERMANLAERLGEMNNNDAARQTRPNPVTLPANANAGLAANPSPRAGDLPFTLSAGDADGDTLALTAQHANRNAAAPASAANAAARAPQPPAGSPAEQVSVQIRHGLRNESDRINVRLQPASLGKVEVKLELGPDKTVNAIVTAEKPETLDMLARDARVLQRALEQAGLQTDSNSLTFQHNGSGGNDATGFAGGNGGNAGSNEAASGEDAMATETASTEAPASSRSTHDGVLDVEI